MTTDEYNKVKAAEARTWLQRIKDNPEFYEEQIFKREVLDSMSNPVEWDDMTALLQLYGAQQWFAGFAAGVK